MAEHTPGPWEWTANTACQTELKGAFVFIQENGRHCTLAAVGARDVGHQGICEANARLIAKAWLIPELVEALEEATDSLMGKGILKSGHTDAVIARSRAVLAKVEEATP